MLLVFLAFQDAHRLVDRDAPLDDGGIGRRREDLAALDALVDARRVVVGDILTWSSSPRSRRIGIAASAVTAVPTM